MPTIWFIRHAESKSNVGLPTSIPKSVELTNKGVEQARHIATIFQSPPSLIVTSSYKRTKQTAEPTLLRFPWACEEEWPVHEFTYLSSTHKEKTTTEERRPQVDAFWERCDPFYTEGQGSESFYHFIIRVSRVIRRLRYTKHDFMAIFSHEQFIHAVLWLSQTDPIKISSASMRDFKSFLTLSPMPNGAILQVQFHNSQELWQYEMMTSHLEKLEPTA